MFASFANDLRFAVRAYRQAPAFTLTALFILALGTGGAAAVWSVYKAVLLEPLAYPRAEQLVILWERDNTFPVMSVAYPNFLDYEASRRTLSHLAIYRREGLTLTGHGDPERLAAATVSHAFFDVLGLPAAEGRSFGPDDDRPGAAPTVILSRELRERLFPAGQDALGKLLVLDGVPHQVVGVMPEAMQSPRGAQAWVPLGERRADPSWQERGNHPGLFMLGRLREDATLEEAKADFAAISARLAAEHPGSNRNVRVEVQEVFENVVGDYRRGLQVLLGSVLLVQLIACLNLAQLLMARGVRRQGELAIRSALGAGRRRIVRQVLTENLLLAVLGALLGLVLAGWARDGIVALAPDDIPRFQDVRIDAGVMAATLGLALATGLLAGLWPAIRASGVDVRGVLNAGGRTTSEGPSAARLRRLLVAGEVALTLVLLVGAGLLVRSLLALRGTDLGFDPAPLVLAQVSLPPVPGGDRDREVARNREFFDRLLGEVRRLPGVEGAALNAQPPLRTGWQSSFSLVGREPFPPGEQPSAELGIISDGYFATLGVPLLRGREFVPGDGLDPTFPVIIDERFASLHWPGEDPLGKQLRFGDDSTPPLTVIGVVPTLRVYGAGTAPELVQLYRPQESLALGTTHLVLRSAGDPSAFLPALRRTVAALDPDLPLFAVRTLREDLEREFANPRLYATLTALFAVTAFVLATVGLYGVLAYTTAGRTRELGIRLALGARPAQVAGLVVREGLGMVAVGLVLGLAIAAGVAGLVRGLLFGVEPIDPLVFAAGTLLLAGTALVATLAPARRAARIGVVEALREE